MRRARPRAALGVGLRDDGVACEEDERALATLDQWFERVEAPSASAFALRGMLEHRLGRHEAALRSVNGAIARAPEPDEGWYMLRFALQLEQGDRAGAIETLETLNSKWPTAERARQLEALRAGEQ